MDDVVFIILLIFMLMMSSISSSVVSAGGGVSGWWFFLKPKNVSSELTDNTSDKIKPMNDVCGNIGEKIEYGKAMYECQYLESVNKKYIFYINKYGTFEIYDTVDKKIVWNGSRDITEPVVNTVGKYEIGAIGIAEDGTFLIFDKISKTYVDIYGISSKVSKIIMEDTGRCVVYNGATEVWSRGVPK